jgi:hypothetical protein
MIESVISQTYDDWQLCIAFSGDDDLGVRLCLKEFADREPRIRLKPILVNEGISGNSNQALTLATGDFLALLDHDDTLAPFALFEVVQLLNQDRSANFIYSDKDQILEDGRRSRPLFKPRWSPDLMLNANYLTHLCVMRTEHVREIGGWRAETDGAQDWDLFLRIIRRYGNVRHIPKVLYHWRQIKTSVALSGLQAKPYAAKGQERAVQDHCDEIGLRGAIARHENHTLRIQWPARAPGEKVSLILLSVAPTAETLEWVESVVQMTDHAAVEILVPLGSDAPAGAGFQLVRTPQNATLRDLIDAAVRVASGSTLVFLGEPVVPCHPDWLNELVGPLQLAEVGVVGARLVDPRTGFLRHGGLVVTGDGRIEYIHAGYREHVF